ncbi:aminotransferase class I/II-fold pyridoxal phosphate-dependent enzyme [Streptomyces sioyaensis]|uniref:aminotransferase-like domain-containing protein n=1 Tax=Streptomyces sioyaensis TaxID=67364 RepID=UPI0036E3A80E
MEDSWATFGRDLHLDLSGPGGLRAALLRALREAVRSGRLAPGTRLPSSRSLAADLGIARNTVADAYAELIAEGWLSARQGSGTRVAERVLPRTAPAARRTPGPSHRAGRPRFDLTAGTPDVAAFPRTAWLAAARRALTAAPSEAFGYGTPAGRPELRAVLADYLARARGVRTDPDHIVLCTGFMQGLALLSRTLGAGRLATESYGLGFHRDVIERAGLRTVPLGVDEHGARTEELAALDDLRAALLTPAHQFPTGVPLHPDRRAAAVNWARATGGYVLEDDYDGEFRYDRQPVDPTPWQLEKCPVQGMRKPRPAHGGTCRPGPLRDSAVQVPVLLQYPQCRHEAGPEARTTGVLRECPRVPARQAAHHPLMLHVGYRFAATVRALIHGPTPTPTSRTLPAWHRSGSRSTPRP